MRLRFCFCLCLRFSRRVALIWSNFYFICIQCLVLFRISACALFQLFLFVPKWAKSIDIQLITSLLLSILCIYWQISRKAGIAFLLFCVALFLLFCFCFCLCLARSGVAVLLIYGLMLFVLFAKNFYVNIYVFVQNMNCKLKIENQKTIKKLKIENRKCKSRNKKQKLIFEN